MREALAREIEAGIGGCCGEPRLRQAMLEVLAQPGFARHPDAPCRAGSLTLLVYRSLNGPPDGDVLRAAAGVELVMEAAYLFDRVADGQPLPSGGPGPTLAVALGLLTCGYALADEGTRSCGRVLPGGMARLYRNALDACAGQFLDARWEKRPLASPRPDAGASVDEALAMTALKSGSFGRLAAELGAGLAAAAPPVAGLCADFGFNLFTYAQLVDDLRDLDGHDGEDGDLARGKKTVPVVFYLNSLLQSSPEAAAPMASGLPADPCLEAGAGLGGSGARVFGAVIAEVFLNRARAGLDALRSCGAEVSDLGEFLQVLVAQTPEGLALVA